MYSSAIVERLKEENLCFPNLTALMLLVSLMNL